MPFYPNPFLPLHIIQRRIAPLGAQMHTFPERHILFGRSCNFQGTRGSALCLSLIHIFRAGGAGLGGVLTPVGIDTLVEESPLCLGRQTVEGKDYLLMKPIHADFALLGTYECDESVSYTHLDVYKRQPDRR